MIPVNAQVNPRRIHVISTRVTFFLVFRTNATTRPEASQARRTDEPPGKKSAGILDRHSMSITVEVVGRGQSLGKNTVMKNMDAPRTFIRVRRKEKLGG